MSYLEKVAEWMADLFEKRTKLLEANLDGKGCDIEWIDPGNRVVYSEVRAHWPEAGGPENRVALQPLFERALRKRGLLKVLKGKI